MNLKDIVLQALKNARENGYGFANMTSREIANDMLTFDSQLEEANLEEVTKILDQVLLEEMGYSVEDMGKVWGSNFAGQFRWINDNVGDGFGCIQYSIEDAWADALQFQKQL